MLMYLNVKMNLQEVKRIKTKRKSNFDASKRN